MKATSSRQMAAARKAAPGYLHAQLASLLLLAAVHHILAAPPHYEPWLWNKSCNYTINSIPAAVFFNRTGDNEDALFPISPGYRIPRQEGDKDVLAVVQLSCFGPRQRVNQTLVAAGNAYPAQHSATAWTAAAGCLQHRTCDEPRSSLSSHTAPNFLPSQGSKCRVVTESAQMAGWTTGRRQHVACRCSPTATATA